MWLSKSFNPYTITAVYLSLFLFTQFPKVTCDHLHIYKAENGKFDAFLNITYRCLMDHPHWTNAAQLNLVEIQKEVKSLTTLHAFYLKFVYRKKLDKNHKLQNSQVMTEYHLRLNSSFYRSAVF